jgi:5'-3' exonuclease
MGIKNLNRFIQKHAPQAHTELHLENYRHKTIAVDTNIYLFRYKSLSQHRWLNTFMNLVLTLKKYDIHCIFTYDTRAPPEKDFRKKERKERKRNAEERLRHIRADVNDYEIKGEVSPLLQEITLKRYTKVKRLLNPVETNHVDMEAVRREIRVLENQMISVSSRDIELSKKGLDLLGIQHYDSPSEAETLCAYFCCHSKVDAVLSNDTDVLVYGTPLFMTKLNIQREVFTEIQHDVILDSLGMTKEEFTDFCIMCGTDYNKNIYKIGNEKSYKLIREHKRIDHIEQNTSIDVTDLNYHRVRQIFKVPEKLDEHYCFKNTNADFEGFMQFVQTHNITLNDERITLVRQLSVPQK